MIRLVIGDRRSLRKGVPNDEEPRPACLDIAVGTKPLLALRPVHPIHDATVGSIEQVLFIVRRGAPPQPGSSTIAPTRPEGASENGIPSRST